MTEITTDAGRSTIDPQSTTEGPWDVDWSNEVRRREEGVDEVSDLLLRKRKSRHLARKRDISRSRAAHVLKIGDAEVADEVVL